MATKKQQSKQPANTLRCGNIKATIWEIDLPPFITPKLRKLIPVPVGPRFDSW